MLLAHMLDSGGQTILQNIAHQIALNFHFVQQYVLVADRKCKTNMLAFDDIEKSKQITGTLHEHLAASQLKKTVVVKLPGNQTSCLLNSEYIIIKCNILHAI